MRAAAWLAVLAAAACIGTTSAAVQVSPEDIQIFVESLTDVTTRNPAVRRCLNESALSFKGTDSMDDARQELVATYRRSPNSMFPHFVFKSGHWRFMALFTCLLDADLVRASFLRRHGANTLADMLQKTGSVPLRLHTEYVRALGRAAPHTLAWTIDKATYTETNDRFTLFHRAVDSSNHAMNSILGKLISPTMREEFVQQMAEITRNFASDATMPAEIKQAVKTAAARIVRRKFWFVTPANGTASAEGAPATGADEAAAPAMRITPVVAVNLHDDKCQNVWHPPNPKRAASVGGDGDEEDDEDDEQEQEEDDSGVRYAGLTFRQAEIIAVSSSLGAASFRAVLLAADAAERATLARAKAEAGGSGALSTVGGTVTNMHGIKVPAFYPSFATLLSTGDAFGRNSLHMITEVDNTLALNVVVRRFTQYEWPRPFVLAVEPDALFPPHSVAIPATPPQTGEASAALTVTSDSRSPEELLEALDPQARLAACALFQQDVFGYTPSQLALTAGFVATAKRLLELEAATLAAVGGLPLQQLCGPVFAAQAAAYNATLAGPASGSQEMAINANGAQATTGGHDHGGATRGWGIGLATPLMSPHTVHYWPQSAKLLESPTLAQTLALHGSPPPATALPAPPAAQKPSSAEDRDDGGWTPSLYRQPKAQQALDAMKRIRAAHDAARAAAESADPHAEAGGNASAPGVFSAANARFATGLWTPACDIDVVDGSTVTETEFLRQYLIPHRPVLLKGLASNWSVRDSYRKRNVLARHGREKWPISEVPYFVDALTEMPLEDFVRGMYKCAPPGHASGGVLNASRFEVADPLAAEALADGSGTVKKPAPQTGGINCTVFTGEVAPYIFGNVQSKLLRRYSPELQRLPHMHAIFPVAFGADRGPGSLVRWTEANQTALATSSAPSNTVDQEEEEGGDSEGGSSAQEGPRRDKKKEPEGDPNSFDELYESQGRKTKKRKPRLQSTIPLLEEDFIMQLYIGVPGSGAPMHYHFDAYNVLLWGTKEWFLQPPPHAESSSVSIADYVAYQYDLTPDAKKPLMCRQEPGDVLYVPWGWGHAVLNMETAVGYAIEGRTAFERYK